MCDEIGGAGSQPLPAVNIAIVQWSHTLRMQNALLLARRQVLEARRGSPAILWGHHVLLQSCNPGFCRNRKAGDCVYPTRDAAEADHCVRQTAVLASRGLRENVSCYSSAAMARALPALGAIRDIFEKRGPHAKNLRVGEYRWCWHTCDGACALARGTNPIIKPLRPTRRCLSRGSDQPHDHTAAPY